MGPIVDQTERVGLEALKIAVLSRGVRATPATIVELSGDDTLSTHEYPTTGGLACRVGDVYLNAPFDEWFCDEAEVGLEVVDGVGMLRHDGAEFAIDEIFPVPDYVGRIDPQGRPYDDVVFSHLDRIRLSPIVGCAYDCAFCDLPGRIDLRPYERLAAAAEMALDDARLPIRHMLISGGSPGPRHQSEFADTITRLVERFSPTVEVDVMMSSGPGTAELVHRLADAGVYGMALNMEVASEDNSVLHLRSKHRRARPYLAETISAAVERLGSTGRVRSLIIPGLESTDETLRGVAEIAALGADPVLSPFRPAEDTALRRHPPVDPEVLRLVLDGARAIVADHGVALGPRCLPCQHNTLTFPWDVPDAA